MAGDRIDIEVQDKISASISKKLEGIAKGADKADREIQDLNRTVNVSRDSNIKLLQAQNRLEREQIKLRKSQLDLNKERAKAAPSAHRLEVAENRLAAASLRVSASQRSIADVVRRADAAKKKAIRTNKRLSASQKMVSRTARGVNTDLGIMTRSLLVFAGGAGGVGAVIGLGEQFTVLQNKVRNVVDTEEQLASVTDRIFDVANRTRTAVDATAQAFQRFDRALIQLGAPQEETLRLTETINKQLILSGAAASEQSAALLQLSQAFNKGKLDGDEFRSVMELMPGVADAIAGELGVMRGELLKLAPEGVITAEVMRNALAGVADEVDRKFSKTIPTIGQSFTVLRNRATQFFGELDKKYGITRKISELILTLSENMDLLAVALATIGSLMFVAFGPQILAHTSKFFALLASNPVGLVIIGLTTLVALLAVFKDDIKVTSDGMVTLGDVAVATFQTIANLIQPVTDFFRDSWNAAFDSASDGASGFAKRFGGVLKTTKNVLTAYLNFVIAGYVGAYKSVSKTWRRLPEVFKDIFFLASKYALTGIEKMVNASIRGINYLIDLVNKMNKKLGIKTTDFRIDFALDLSSFKQQGSNAAVEVANTIRDEFSRAFSQDYVGDFARNVSLKSRELARARMAASGLPAPALRGKKAVSRTASGGGRGAAAKKEEAEYTAPVMPYSIMSGQQGELNRIYDDTIVKNRELTAAIKDTNTAYQMGMITLVDYQKRMVDLSVATAEWKLEMGNSDFVDVITVALDEVRGNFENVATSIAGIFGELFDDLSDGFADSIGDAIVMGDDLGDSLQRVAKRAMADLISSVIKMGIQWAVTQAMQKTAMASMTATSTAAAATQQAAWTPAATTASIATLGGAAAIGLAAVIASVVASKAGFQSGGYTGNSGTDDVAGVVHGREFVMDAASTSRLGVGNLEALRNGSATVAQAQGGNTTNNYNADAGETRVIIVKDPNEVPNYLNSPDGREFIVNVMNEENEMLL